MYIIDYLDNISNNEINISPFHTGHLGFIPDTEVHSCLLKSDKRIGHEICITHYQPSKFEYLFRLKCVLKEKKGVFHKLLKAISIMKLNVVSSESVTLESKKGHGVSLLLDWSSTKFTKKITLPSNIRNLFFPALSNLVPSNDRRYLILLRQILAHCGDVIDWGEEDESGISYPRIKITEFDEKRIDLDSDRGSIIRPIARERNDKYRSKIQRIKSLFKKNNIDQNFIAYGNFRDLLKKSGIKLQFKDSFLTNLRTKSGRDLDSQKIPYISLSDIESKTLRLFIPSKSAESKIINLSLSHKDRPGALFAITKLLADSGFSIYSSLVRKYKPGINIFEATLEHESKEIKIKGLNENPNIWVKDFFNFQKENNEELCRYFNVKLENPQYPSQIKIESTQLLDGEPIEEISLFEEGQEETQVTKMKKRFETKDSFKNQRWLTNLLFSHEWGPKGLPRLFISFPKCAQNEIAHIKQLLNKQFHVDVLQGGNLNEKESKNLTTTAIDRIKKAQYFIGFWKSDEKESGGISPWMHFEYGVARSHNKPITLLTDEKLSATLFRIDSDKRRIVFRDFIGNDEVINQLKRDTTEWAAEHERLTL